MHHLKADDVTATLELALDASGLDKASVLHRPRPLSDNGSSYISDDLAKWMTRHAMAHVRGAPYHPMTQGKIGQARFTHTLRRKLMGVLAYAGTESDSPPIVMHDEWPNPLCRQIVKP